MNRLEKAVRLYSSPSGSRWGRALSWLGTVVLAIVIVTPVWADPDVLILDDFEENEFSGWDLIGNLPPHIQAGTLVGTQLVAFPVPEQQGLTGGGIPGGICQNHRLISSAQVGLWVDFSQLDLNVGNHFRLVTLSPNATDQAFAGIQIWQASNGVIKMRAFVRETGGSWVHSPWHSIPREIVESEPLFFTAAWTVSDPSLQTEGTFEVQVSRANGRFLLGASLASLNNMGQYVTYTRFGMLEAVLTDSISGQLAIDRVQLNEMAPIEVAPLSGYDPGAF